MKHAVINDKNEVVNTIIWDRVSPWSPPKGHSVVQSDHANIGDLYDPHTKTFLPKVAAIKND